MPGHYAIFNEKEMKISRYWQLSFSQDEDNDKPISEWTEELKELLHDACRIRLRADVPVGTYLSGGLDSSYISSLVKHSFNNKVCTFSWGLRMGASMKPFFRNRLFSPSERITR